MSASFYAKFLRIVFAGVISVLLFSSSLFAQNSNAGKSLVTLKSGEVVKGKIIEAKPDQYIKVELDDHTIKTISASEIGSIESADEKKSPKVGVSIIGGVSAGYDVSSGLNYIVVDPRVVVGAKVNQNRFGLGLGFIYGYSATVVAPHYDGYGNYTTSRQNLLYFPMYFNYHGEFGKKKVLPSADVSVGYPLNVQSPLTYDIYDDQNSGTTKHYEVGQRGLAYLDLSPGVSFKVSKKVMINVAANFKMLAFQELHLLRQTFDGLTGSAANFTVGNTTTVNATRAAFTIGAGVNIIY